jgi:hypothetical protein
MEKLDLPEMVAASITVTDDTSWQPERVGDLANEGEARG